MLKSVALRRVRVRRSERNAISRAISQSQRLHRLRVIGFHRDLVVARGGTGIQPRIKFLDDHIAHAPLRGYVTIIPKPFVFLAPNAILSVAHLNRKSVIFGHWLDRMQEQSNDEIASTRTFRINTIAQQFHLISPDGAFDSLRLQEHSAARE